MITQQHIIMTDQTEFSVLKYIPTLEINIRNIENMRYDAFVYFLRGNFND